MNHWKKLAAAAAVLVIGASGGVAWASQATPGPDGREASATPPPAQTNALGGGTTETKFVPVTPCRLVDTRFGTPKPAVGTERSFKVRGTGAQFATQGGTAGGCGIPSGATGIEASVTAAAPTGVGFLRMYPGAAPNATFLNFTGGQATTNTGAVRICSGICLINSDLRFKVFGSSTDVVVDVQGYYIAPMAAFIETNGNVIRGSRVTATTQEGTGTYTVTFDRDISTCSYSASSNYYGDIINVTSGFDNNSVFVKAVTDAGAAVNIRFFVEVTC